MTPDDDKFVGGKGEADAIVAAIRRGTAPEMEDDAPEIETAGLDTEARARERGSVVEAMDSMELLGPDGRVVFRGKYLPPLPADGSAVYRDADGNEYSIADGSEHTGR